MRFTSEDLIKAKKALAEIVRYNSEEEYDNGVEIGYVNPLQDECYLISKALEELERLLPRPKRVGDLRCDDFECCDCPIGFLCDYKIPKYAENKEPTLYQMFEYYNVTDQEIYDLLKVRLDKEVE